MLVLEKNLIFHIIFNFLINNVFINIFTGEKKSFHSRESNVIYSDIKQQLSSATNYHLVIKEDKVCQQKPATSNNPTQLIGDSLFHESQQDGTFIQDNSNISRKCSEHTNSCVTTSPTSVWLRKTNREGLSYKIDKSRISLSKSSCLKFGADARDIQHFKTFGSSPDKNAYISQKSSEKVINMSNESHKDSDENIKSLPFYDGASFKKQKALFIQDLRTPTNSKPNKITNNNLISTAPIASLEELSSTTDELRYKKAKQPNLKMKSFSHPLLTHLCYNSNLEDTEETDYVSAPLLSHKNLSFLPTSLNISENKTQQSKWRDKLNLSPIHKYNFSVSLLNTTSNSDVFQLEVPENPQITFV